ncbi:MAG: ABC transporter ATP-binding protein [Acidobacteriota bacterium]
MIVKDVAFGYGATPVVDGVSVEARPGQLLGILGPNGSGKTTLLRLMIGILRPTRGSVTLGGRAIDGIPRRELARQVALVPQDSTVDFPFTVTELVLLGRTPHLPVLGLESPRDVTAAEKAMDACGVRSFASRSVHELSGGELRRVLIARALAQETPVLLLDEPTGGLDIHHQVAIFELLRREARAGRTVVVVVHDLNLAACYCDALVLLKSGRALAQGGVEEVLSYRIVREAYGVDVYVGVNEITGARFLIPMATS